MLFKTGACPLLIEYGHLVVVTAVVIPVLFPGLFVWLAGDVADAQLEVVLHVILQGTAIDHKLEQIHVRGRQDGVTRAQVVCLDFVVCLPAVPRVQYLDRLVVVNVLDQHLPNNAYPTDLSSDQQLFQKHIAVRGELDEYIDLQHLLGLTRHSVEDLEVLTVQPQHLPVGRRSEPLLSGQLRLFLAFAQPPARCYHLVDAVVALLGSSRKVYIVLVVLVQRQVVYGFRLYVNRTSILVEVRYRRRLVKMNTLTTLQFRYMADLAVLLVLDRTQTRRARQRH